MSLLYTLDVCLSRVRYYSTAQQNSLYVDDCVLRVDFLGATVTDQPKQADFAIKI